jgi:hypothetical protein
MQAVTLADVTTDVIFRRQSVMYPTGKRPFCHMLRDLVLQTFNLLGNHTPKDINLPLLGRAFITGILLLKGAV